MVTPDTPLPTEGTIPDDAIKAAYIEGYVAACEHWAGDPVARKYAEKNYPHSQASSDAAALSVLEGLTRFSLFDEGLGVDPNGPYVLYADAAAARSTRPAADAGLERIKAPLPVGVEDTPEVRARVQASLRPAGGEAEPELQRLARQTITDLTAAHAEIVKLQGGDPEKSTWPVWSSPAHTIAWCQRLLSVPVTAVDAARRHGIYIASKVRHAQRWRILRNSGFPIISTWIYEAEDGQSQDLADLWLRCIAEASSAEVLVFNAEPGELFKGAWVELGAALSSHVPVIAVGLDKIDGLTVARHPLITHFATMADVASYLKPMANGTPFRSLNSLRKAQ